MNKRKRSSAIAALISLGLHLIGAMIGTIFIVQQIAEDQDVVQINLTKVTPPRPQRRLPPRRPKTAPATRIKPSVPIPKIQNQIKTTARLPLSSSINAIPTETLRSLPSTDLSDQGMTFDTRKILGASRRANIPTIMPKIGPQRIEHSIGEQIDTDLPGADLQLNDLNEPVFELGDVTKPPEIVKAIKPEYPDLARRAQREGTVLLEAEIGIDGYARKIRVVSGIGYGCDQAAVKALERSRFRPAKQGDQAVIVRVEIPYRFKFEQ